MLEADYSDIETRILAHYYGTTNMEQARTPGFEQIMPSASEAKGWNNLNRKARRASLAKSQAGRPATYDKETGALLTPKRVRLKTQAANVAFARGLEAHGH